MAWSESNWSLVEIIAFQKAEAKNKSHRNNMKSALYNLASISNLNVGPVLLCDATHQANKMW